MLQDLTITTESDYLTQREALEAKLYDRLSYIKPDITIGREDSAPRAKQIKKETEETLGIYGSLGNNFIRAQLLRPEMSDEICHD